MPEVRDTLRPAIEFPWEAYSPSDAAPWSLQRVVHLHRRAGLAAPWPVLERDLQDGPDAAIERTLTGNVYRRDEEQSEFETMAHAIGNAAQASNNPARLQAWWLYRMIWSPDPLTERLTLMWHNHFATSNRKVQDLVMMRSQNEIFRSQNRAPFVRLLSAVVKHPAMLVWLDADSNRKGHPNENLARELMELFTLGIGNYTETDVKEAARALTGWTLSQNAFSYKAERHDDAALHVLGHHGPLTGDELLTLLVEHPATSRRLAWRLCQTFFGEDVVTDAALDELALGLRQHGLDIGWGVETILRSQLFYSPANLGARVLSPTGFLVGTLRALELRQPPPGTLLLAEWNGRMGQELFYPPNVGGWPEGRAWLGSRTIIARANFIGALVEGQIWNPPQRHDLSQLVRRHYPSNSLRESVQWFAGLFWGEPPAGIVEQVLAATEAAANEDSLAAALVIMLSLPEAQLG